MSISSLSISTKTSLPNLVPPYQIVFPGYMRALHSLAKDIFISRDGTGLNGFISTPEEYQALMGNPADLAVHVPAIRPAEPLDNATAVQIAKFTYREAAYLSEQNALASLKQAIIASLDIPTIAGLENNGIGLAGLDCRAIIDFLRLRYGTASPEIFEEYVRTAISPYLTSASIEEHVNSHLTLHRYANDMGQGFNEHRKVETLRGTLNPCGIFGQAMKIYSASHPTFQNRTFVNFSEAMIRERNSTSATTSSEGYSAAMHIRDPRHDLESKIDMLFALMAGKTAKPDTKAPSPSLYCWRHGRCHHKSSDCNRRSEPGHQLKATLSNQMGGKKA